MKKNYSLGLVVPAAVLYSLLYLLPCIMGFWYSFTNWNVSNFSHPKFIGLENYITIFAAESQTYLKPIGNTIGFAFITALFEAAIGLCLAMLFNTAIKTKELLRGIFFLPFIMAPLIIGYVFSAIFHPHGMFNGLLRSIGLDSLTHAWLAERAFAFPTVMFTEIWRYIGLNMVIFIAGLQMIPKSYYESASIDGANYWKTFLHITLPCIIPSLSINTVLNIIHGLNVFDIIYALTNGGPGNATEVLNTLIYSEYSSGRYGLSSALGVVIILLTTFIAVTLQYQISKREVAGL